jgi:4-hydroxy-tetrahydrodipicolinate synthase
VLNLQGRLIPAVPVTFREDQSVDYDALHKYAEYLVAQPIDGVAIWAHTGRGLHLTAEQRLEVGKLWRQHLKPGQILICGIGGDRGHRGAMGKDALKLGADAIMAYAPVMYRGLPNQDALVLEYHRELANYPGLPLILFFLYEAAGGITYSLDLLGELLSLPQAVGIKMATLDSVMTYQDVANYIQKHHPDKVLITGEDRMFGYTLTRGAKSALVGLGSICPAWQRELLDSYADGRAEDFLQAMALVDALAEITFIPPMEGYIERLLFFLAEQGILSHNVVHDPYGPGVTELERAQITKFIREHGLEVGA